MSNSKSKPKQSSMEARPRIKKVREKHPASSKVVPTTPARVYKVIHTSSASKTRLKRLAEVNRKEKKDAQKIMLTKASQVNISRPRPLKVLRLLLDNS